MALYLRTTDAGGGARYLRTTKTPEAGRVYRDLNLRWSALEIAERELSVSWDVLETVSADQEIQWASLQIAQRELELRWDVAGPAVRVDADLRVRWDVSARVQNELRLRWKIDSSIEVPDLTGKITIARAGTRIH